MKILFLDIDGVLNLCYQKSDKYGTIFHPQFIDNLKNIIDKTNPKIVISSTWRHDGIDYLKALWEYRNYPGDIIDITPSLMHKYNTTLCRGKEIEQWLSKNTIDNYCIIDDDSDMEPEQMNNFVKTSENFDHTDHIEGFGLTKECAEQVIKILMK